MRVQRVLPSGGGAESWTGDRPGSATGGAGGAVSGVVVADRAGADDGARLRASGERDLAGNGPSRPVGLDGQPDPEGGLRVLRVPTRATASRSRRHSSTSGGWAAARQRCARQARPRLGADHRRAGPVALGLHARRVRRPRLQLRVREPVGRPGRARDELSRRRRGRPPDASAGRVSLHPAPAAPHLRDGHATRRGAGGISFQSVARRAGVSRQWLYTRTELGRTGDRAAAGGADRRGAADGAAPRRRRGRRGLVGHGPRAGDPRRA